MSCVFSKLEMHLLKRKIRVRSQAPENVEKCYLKEFLQYLITIEMLPMLNYPKSWGRRT